MPAAAVIIALLAVIATAGITQARRHERQLQRIPLRVHVNGIRGKSSVTRLIAGGLRAGGIRTVAKTTGTTPRFIYPDGSEVPVVRAGGANIIEQVRIVRRAAQLEAEALVIECMAVKPELQSFLEDRLIQSTHGVITNARADHLDVMGPTVSDVAHNLARTVPRNGHFFSPDRAYLDVYAEAARERGSVVHAVDVGHVTDAELARFGHVEHAENVATALAVCAELGVDRDTALAGMIAAQPDPGALQLYSVDDEGRRITFINGLAINDPDSYVMTWELLANRFEDRATLVGLVVCRADRIQRSEQLADLVEHRLPLDVCLIAGGGTRALAGTLRRRSITDRRIEDLGGKSAGDIYERVRSLADDRPVVVYGIGNIVGFGEEIVELFRGKGSTGVHRNAA